MEWFVRYVLFFVAPVVQIMMSVWRVQHKIRVPLGAIMLLMFLLSICTTAIAVAIFPGSLSPCIGCDPTISRGRPNGLEIVALGMFIGVISNLIIAGIAFSQFRAGGKCN